MFCILLEYTKTQHLSLETNSVGGKKLHSMILFLVQFSHKGFFKWIKWFAHMWEFILKNTIIFKKSLTQFIWTPLPASSLSPIGEFGAGWYFPYDREKNRFVTFCPLPCIRRELKRGHKLFRIMVCAEKVNRHIRLIAHNPAIVYFFRYIKYCARSYSLNGLILKSHCCGT